MPAANPDSGLYVSIHGRRAGLVGDGVASGGLLVDGTLIGSKRAAIKTVVTGRNGAGAITLTGAKVGDKVSAMINMTTPGDAKANFEATITVDGQIQQSSASDLSTAKFLVELSLQS